MSSSSLARARSSAAAGPSPRARAAGGRGAGGGGAPRRRRPRRGGARAAPPPRPIAREGGERSAPAASSLPRGHGGPNGAGAGQAPSPSSSGLSEGKAKGKLSHVHAPGKAQALAGGAEGACDAPCDPLPGEHVASPVGVPRGPRARPPTREQVRRRRLNQLLEEPMQECPAWGETNSEGNDASDLSASADRLCGSPGVLAACPPRTICSAGTDRVVLMRFEIKYKTAGPQQWLCMAGSHAPLGWSFLSVQDRPMQLVEGTEDVWYLEVPMCAGAKVEYKFCVVESQGWNAPGRGRFFSGHVAIVRWQAGGNLVLTVPEPEHAGVGHAGYRVLSTDEVAAAACSPEARAAAVPCVAPRCDYFGAA